MTYRRFLFAISFVTCAYFVQGAGANQSSRYALVRALVEDHVLSFDRLATTTFDRAVVGVTTYSDKAPGLSLAAALPYALGLRLAQPGDGVEPDPLALHLVTLATVGLASAFAAMLLFDLLVGYGLGATASLLAVLGWILGTNALAYATLFYAHQFVAALLVIALAGIRAFQLGERPRALGVGIGFALGLAAISEYPAISLAGGLGIYALATLGVRRTLPMILGAIVPAIVLAAYNTACFGAPWALGYHALANETFQAGMSGGIAGIGAPDARVLGALLVGEYRGLLPLSPFLVLAVPGYVFLWRRARPLAILCLASFVGYFVLMSGYKFWDGGAALGPRHVIPALPFAIIAVAFALDRARGYLYAALPLLAWSIALCLICTAVRPELPDGEIFVATAPGLAVPDYHHPLRTIAVPMFLAGELSAKATQHGWIGFVRTQKRGHGDDAYNLGERMGLDGAASLLPLLAAWALLTWAACRRSPSARAPARPA